MKAFRDNWPRCFDSSVSTRSHSPMHESSLSTESFLDRVASEGFDLLITGDRNMPFQQSLGPRNIAVIVLPGTDRKKVDLYGAHLAACLSKIVPGRFHYLDKDGRLVSERPS